MYIYIYIWVSLEVSSTHKIEKAVKSWKEKKVAEVHDSAWEEMKLEDLGSKPANGNAIYVYVYIGYVIMGWIYIERCELRWEKNRSIFSGIKKKKRRRSGSQGKESSVREKLASSSPLLTNFSLNSWTSFPNLS